jgi:hypothetical protein
MRLNRLVTRRPRVREWSTKGPQTGPLFFFLPPSSITTLRNRVLSHEIRSPLTDMTADCSPAPAPAPWGRGVRGKRGVRGRAFLAPVHLGKVWISFCPAIVFTPERKVRTYSKCGRTMAASKYGLEVEDAIESSSTGMPRGRTSRTSTKSSN